MSALLGRIPSAVGYQPTLATEMGGMQERITSTSKGSITSVQAIYVPADDLTDPAPATTFSHLDATTVLNRALTEIGIYPAVDPLDSTSTLMDPNIIGARHYRQVAASRTPSRSTRTSRTSSPSSAWTSSPRTTRWSSSAPARSSASSRNRSSRRTLQFTGTPGQYVPVEETIDGFEQILDGKYDDDNAYPEKAFHLVGNIEAMKAKAQRLVEEAKGKK